MLIPQKIAIYEPASIIIFFDLRIDTPACIFLIEIIGTIVTFSALQARAAAFIGETRFIVVVIFVAHNARVAKFSVERIFTVKIIFLVLVGRVWVHVEILGLC